MFFPPHKLIPPCGMSQVGSTASYYTERMVSRKLFYYSIDIQHTLKFLDQTEDHIDWGHVPGGFAVQNIGKNDKCLNLFSLCISYRKFCKYGWFACSIQFFFSIASCLVSIFSPTNCTILLRHYQEDKSRGWIEVFEI